MTKLPFAFLNSLRNRMLLFFLFVIAFIVLITLQIVRSATYSHSTAQLQEQSEISASVVKDKIENQADLLLKAADNISKNFTIKKYIAGAADDVQSLSVAMVNQQKRIKADIFLVLDANSNLLVQSGNREFSGIKPESFAQAGISWLALEEQVYLVKSAPVKFVENSRRTAANAWILLGYSAKKLINQELRRFTDKEIALLAPYENKRILGTTLSDSLSSELVKEEISLDKSLHEIDLANERYIYTSDGLGMLNEQPVYVILVTLQDKAYLSYNSLLLQLIGLLVVAAVLASIAAVLLSRGISGPLNRLVNAANKISQGQYVNALPASSTIEVDELSVAINDMQQGIQQREKQINHLAYFDDLTKLPNRNQFSRHLTEMISHPDNKHVVVLMLDIDRFKDINDTVGHDTGDHLLQLIAKRLSTFEESPAFFARLGGDEFGIVMNVQNEHAVDSAVQCIARIFEQPFNIDGLVLDIDCSIGASVFPKDAISSQGLMQCADIALYSCKGTHFDFALYDKSLNKHSVQRLNLMSELKGALSEGQLQLYYQPKLLIAENRIASVECLIRWIHPEHGFIPPDEFIPLAEQTGAIRHVTNWGLRVALAQQRKWSEMGHDITVAVNISAIDLIDMGLPTLVSNLLSEFKVEPEMLTLEVTESAIMSDPQSALSALNTLKRMGIELSIDDFGTGYSSMAQLKDMPVHELKIDKAFVLNLANNKDDQIMVKTMVSLAQNLSLKTVAEGVEDPQSLAILSDIGCTKAQGFYLSKPLPEVQFNAWLDSFNNDNIKELNA